MKRQWLSIIGSIVLALLAAGASRADDWLSTLQPDGSGENVTELDANPICAAQGKNCGLIDDGQGGKVDCGTCTGYNTCGGSGIPNVCGCTPKDCTGLNCGTIDRGCLLGTLTCGGPCSGFNTCGGGGSPNVCGCTPKTCAGKNCGTIEQGCGLPPLSCGSMCSGTDTCGGGGVPNLCGCTPKGCDGRCGTVDDGCGKQINCGQCCTPRGCGGRCGTVSDGCGKQIYCGPCCTPRGCSGLCGSVDDGCGNRISCRCPTGMRCQNGICEDHNPCSCGGPKFCEICTGLELQILSLRDGAQERKATTRSLRLLNLRKHFPAQWARFSKPADLSLGNVFEFTMERPLFPRLGQEKTLRITAITLFARGKAPANRTYTVDLTTPSTADTLRLSPVQGSGGLRKAQKDALDLELAPTGPPVLWKLEMTRADGGKLQIGEVKDIFLVLEYETE